MPQGSRPSAYIVSKVLESVLSGIAAVAATTHGDDGLVDFKTLEAAVSSKSALALAFAEHPVGPLLMKTSIAYELGAQADYLGYWLKRRAPGWGGYGMAVPSHKARLRCRKRAASILAFMPGQGHLEFIKTRASAWALSFGEWKGRNFGIVLAEIDLCGDPLLLAEEFQSSVATIDLKDSDSLSLWYENWLPLLEYK